MDTDRPFHGIRVIEFGQFIAVPYCAQLLSEGGAYVIKIESLDGDPTRVLAPIENGESRHYLTRNRGKHILPLDLRNPATRGIIDALLATTDVILTNFRPGLAEEFGLDYPALKERFPRLIVANATAFGTRGPDANLAGMDLVVQARSGLMSALGREVDGLPASGEPSIVDYTCAMTLAFGISSALLRRERTGQGGEVRASLLMAAMTLQNTAMVRVDEHDGADQERALGALEAAREAGAPFQEQTALMPVNRVSWMNSIYLRVYMTKDRPLAVACASRKLQTSLLRALGIKDAWLGRPANEDRAAFAAHYEAFEREMEATFATKTAAEWKAAFEREGVAYADVKFPLEMLSDEQTEANEMVATVPHPTLGDIRVLGSPVKMDGDGFQASVPSALYGTESRAILAAAGFSESEVDAYVSGGVTREKYAGR